jgi:hypothetical protein
MELSFLDYILTISLSYIIGIGTGLSICCHWKEKFLQRVKSNEDLSRYNHQNLVYPPTSPVITAQPSAPAHDVVNISLK